MDRNYFIDDLEMIEENEEILPLLLMYKPCNNRFEDLTEDEFKYKYRFSRSTEYCITEMLKNDLAGNARGGFIPPHIKVLPAIRTWARGQIQDDAGDLNGFSQPTISLVCKQVALAIVGHRDQWIKMPASDIERNSVIADFYAICGFRQVIGTIDCTHIRIPKISGDISQYYIKRKGYSSINVQMVSNANLEIMDIVAHWRGSTHGSRIFNDSRLKQRFERGEFKGRLLGDSGYACTPYLFTPILHPATNKEKLYNRAHIHARNSVERYFGVWKQRFHCLLRGFKTKLDNTKLYTVASAVLHNIAMQKINLVPEAEVSSVLVSLCCK